MRLSVIAAKIMNLEPLAVPSAEIAPTGRSSTEPIRRQNSDWTLIIRAKANWFDLHLADLWRYRDLVELFVRRDFVSQYKQTLLGPLWFILQPLLTTLTFTLIFGHIAQLSTDGLPKILFYLSGVTAWTYFADCLSRPPRHSPPTPTSSAKSIFPDWRSPLSIVISNLMRFGIQPVCFWRSISIFLPWRGVACHLGLFGSCRC